MSSKLAQLREVRNVKAKAANDLNNAHPSDKAMPKAEIDKLNAILAEIEAIDEDIATQSRLAKLAAEQTDALLNRVTVDPSKQSEESKAFRAFLAGGMAGLTREQFAAMQGRQSGDIRNAMTLPQAAMSTTTPAEGGFTVATEYMRSLEVALKDFGGMLEAASSITTGSGAQMQFPTADPTAEVGAILAQNATTGRADTTFGNVAIDVYKYTSNDIALPLELVQDTFIDLEAYIREVLVMRLGRITNQHFTTGTGTGQPRGIVTAASLGKTGTTGQTLSVIYDDLVDLEHSVDPAYRRMAGAGFMMHDTSLRVVRKIKDTQGRPIFVPGYEQGNPGGAPDRLLNRPIYINQDMPVMAANAKSILFGAYRKYVIRRVMDLTMWRFTDSAFSRLGQVGYLAMQRIGGNLVDVSGSSVKYYANSAT